MPGAMVVISVAESFAELLSSAVVDTLTVLAYGDDALLTTVTLTVMVLAFWTTTVPPLIVMLLAACAARTALT